MARQLTTRTSELVLHLSVVTPVDTKKKLTKVEVARTETLQNRKGIRQRKGWLARSRRKEKELTERMEEGGRRRGQSAVLRPPIRLFTPCR
jgi:hypothetical protein